MKVRREYTIVVEEDATETLLLQEAIPKGTKIYIGQKTRLWDFWDPRTSSWWSVNDHIDRFHQVCDMEARYDERYR